MIYCSLSNDHYFRFAVTALTLRDITHRVFGNGEKNKRDDLARQHIRYIVKLPETLRMATTHMKHDLWTIFGKFGQNYCTSPLAGRTRLAPNAVDKLILCRPSVWLRLAAVL